MTAAPKSSLHGVLVVDKAQGPTSHDVVGVARRVLKTREIGHTGTLDPMATGVLVLVVGEATKLVNLLGASDKAYRATLKLGTATHTLDAQGEVTEELPVPAISLEGVRTAAQRFVGEIDQRVPAVSAIKVDGQSLYKKARKGQAVDAPTRRVRLDTLSIEAVREREIELALRCGKGFYVRSLGRDLAEALGTCGHLSALRRTHNGKFGLEQAVDFEALRAAARGDEALAEEIRARLIPLAKVCQSLPHVTLLPAGVEHARHGRAVPASLISGLLPALEGEESCVAFDPDGVPVALVQRSGDGLRVARGFRQG